MSPPWPTRDLLFAVASIKQAPHRPNAHWSS